VRVYEEDLPFLQHLPKPIHWSITIISDPEAGTIPGTIDWISEMIDPNEHMGLASGYIDNPRGEYRAGQFIIAQVDLPPEGELVEIPTRALVEDGDESVVLVQMDPSKNRYTRRRVSVARRYHDVVHIRSFLTPEQKEDGYEELHVGEQVVACGALELKEALQQRQAAAKADSHP
jgi:cobalt-zinc-cadmium efflux system membrane fusion protein